MKIKRVIEIEESDLERIRDIVERENKTALSVTTRGTAYITIADSKPYDTSVDCISREGIRKALNEAFDCEDATKYGNKNAEQQSKSYSTLMLYEIADIVEDCCDNAPTVKFSLLPADESKDEAYMRGYEHGLAVGLLKTRPKGEWLIVGHDDTTYWYRCSICEYEEHDNFTKHYHYCPSCGADMGEVKKMNDEKAIEQLEEFLVIDDWSAVYMPKLQDAIEYVINRIKADNDLIKAFELLKAHCKNRECNKDCIFFRELAIGENKDQYCALCEIVTSDDKENDNES